MDSDDDEDYEEKNVLRDDCRYLVYKITKAIGFVRVYKVIGARIVHSLTELSNKEETGNPLLISRLEGDLFCLTGALKFVNEYDPEAIEAVQQILDILLNINCPKQKVTFVILEIISKCSAFFGQRKELLSKAIKFLGSCITYEKFEDISAEAISNLCQRNKNFVIDHLDDFILCKPESSSLQ